MTSFFQITTFFKNPCFLISLYLMFSACSTTKSLQDDEMLYRGAEIDILDKSGFERISLKSDMKDLKEPKPNSYLLGFIPAGLWIYHMAWDSVPDKGFKHWVKYRLGEPPVIYDYHITRNVENDIQNYLYNKGFFDSNVRSSGKSEAKKISLTYQVEAGGRYRIQKYAYPEVNDSLTGLIDSLKESSYIKEGDEYDLETFKHERQRLNEALRNEGYFYFSPDYLIFRVDSNYSEKSLDVYLSLKQGIPAKSRNKYYLNEVDVYADYSLGKDSSSVDTIPMPEFRYLSRDQFIRPHVLGEAIALKSGNLFRFRDYSATLNKVMGLGVYKYASVQFKESETVNDTSWLDSDIFLTRSIPKSLRLQFQLVSKSNDFAGPGIRASYQDRNTFGGAENFMLNLNASFETQIASNQESLNSLQLGADANFRIPRFVFPFIEVNRFLSENYTPSTNIRAGYTFYDRTDMFIMNSVFASYGYSWRETRAKSHDFTLLNIDFSRLTRKSADFDSILNNNPLVRESFAEQFILGLMYQYTYNNQTFEDKWIQTYFQVNNEFAGNTISLTRDIFNIETSENGRETFFGIPYAQYARTSADLRFNTNISNYNKLVYRIFAGIGIPYGNSSTLPYRKQYYIGGASSVRAFQYRSVGPGTWEPDSADMDMFFDQTGDIKLETNLEYRFNIYKMLKAALFLDAGNIWLLNRDPAKPGGKFEIADLLSEMAVGTGFGLRFDASFFVLRLDLGMPLRKPYFAQGERWVLDRIDFGSPGWRRENLVLNIAIGYPF